MRRFYAIALLGALGTILGALGTLALWYGSGTIVSATSTLASSASTAVATSTTAPRRLVALEVKVIEANQLAMSSASLRLNSIDPRGADTEMTEKALQLLKNPDAEPGVKLIADLSYTVAAGNPARFSSGVDSPTQTTSVGGSGISVQGFGGYEKSEVSATFTSEEAADNEILLNVAFQTRNRIGQAVDGMPPSRASRAGSFAAQIPSGEMRVYGGMMRSDQDGNYLLFFLKPSWVD